MIWWSNDVSGEKSDGDVVYDDDYDADWTEHSDTVLIDFCI